MLIQLCRNLWVTKYMAFLLWCTAVGSTVTVVQFQLTYSTSASFVVTTRDRVTVRLKGMTRTTKAVLGLGSASSLPLRKQPFAHIF